MTPEEEKKFKAHMRRAFFWNAVSIIPVSMLLAAVQADVTDTITVCFLATLLVFVATSETKK